MPFCTLTPCTLTPCTLTPCTLTPTRPPYSADLSHPRVPAAREAAYGASRRVIGAVAR
jgi:hypothetical protein